MSNLDRVKKALEEAADFQIPPAEAEQRGLCAACGKPALERCYSDAGRREFQISGMCELCFDESCAEPAGLFDPDEEPELITPEEP